jgi:hypothetical protein
VFGDQGGLFRGDRPIWDTAFLLGDPGGIIWGDLPIWDTVFVSVDLVDLFGGTSLSWTVFELGDPNTFFGVTCLYGTPCLMFVLVDPECPFGTLCLYLVIWEAFLRGNLPIRG